MPRLRGHAYLAEGYVACGVCAVPSVEAVRVRSLHEGFHARRAAWLFEHWYLDWAGAEGTARREQELALFYAARGAVSFGYGWDLEEWYELRRMLRADGDPAAALISAHIEAEEERLRTTQFIDASYVTRPYVPAELR